MVKTKNPEPQRLAFGTRKKADNVHKKQLCILKGRFGKLVQEALCNNSDLVNYKIEEAALLALQEATKMFCKQVFEDANHYLACLMMNPKKKKSA